MIINPSAHTMTSPGNSFRRRFGARRKSSLSIPGGKIFWLGTAKIMGIASVFLFVASFFLDGSLARVNEEISMIEGAHSELLNTNVLLRAKKAMLFSPQTVGTLAEEQLAIHIPTSGQYKKF